MKRPHPCYAGDHARQATNLREAARLLERGPWFWPRTGDWEALKVAQMALDRHGAGDAQRGPGEHARVGQILLVGYDEQDASGSLWLLDLSTDASGGEAFEFLAEAKEAWRDAVSAVSRSVPVLWKPLSDQVERELVATPGAQATDQLGLDGRSYGLSFGLALVSKLLDRPMPCRWTATAQMNHRGELQGVDGLKVKIDTIWGYAPGVNTLLVAQEQEEEAKDYVGGRPLEVKGVKTLTEAVDEVFDDLPAKLVEAGERPEQRRELIEKVFHLCLSRRDGVVDWTPVGRAAHLMRQRWRGLSPELVQKLTLAEAVARRHQANEGEVELPSRQWIDELPNPQRLEVVAQLVQQSTDTGMPAEEEALEFGQAYLVDGADAFGPHIKLRGALGRLCFILGDVEGALEMQREAVQQWIGRRQGDEISYPLSYAYMVAGALGDKEQLESLREAERHWRSLAGAEPAGEDYVLAFRGRAEALCGRWERALETLGVLEDRVIKHASFQRMVDRWWICAAESFGEGGEGYRKRLEHHGWRGAPECKHHWWLEMVRAVRVEDQERALTCATRFVETEDKIARRLIEYAGCPSDEWARFLWQRYPY